MPLNFPSSPTPSTTYTFNNKTWTYNGNAWALTTGGSLNTSVVPEGSNLYFSNARVYSNVSQLGYITSSSLSGYATNAQLTSFATTANSLSQFASTTSSQLATLISDETGTGSLVFATSPTLVTPALGTPSALVGTNITGTAANFNINGTVGATTANTGAFTTLAASSTVTLSGGTANGVTYLNGSKVLTSGSALVFDGSRLLAGLSSNLSGARLQVQGATDTAFTALSVNATTNDGYMGIGYSSSGNVWQIWPTYNATAGYKPLAFVVGGSEVARFPTASGFQCVNSISVGNATPTTSGAGITFPATQSASTDANTLDDYEEGTWTPADGSGAGLSLTTTKATYVKVGSQVTVQCYTTYPSTADVSGAVISGLPFAAAANSYGTAAVSTGAAAAGPIIRVAAGGTTGVLFGGASTVTAITNGMLTSQFVIFTGTYFV